MSKVDSKYYLYVWITPQVFTCLPYHDIQYKLLNPIVIVTITPVMVMVERKDLVLTIPKAKPIRLFIMLFYHVTYFSFFFTTNFL